MQTTMRICCKRAAGFHTMRHRALAGYSGQAWISSPSSPVVSSRAQASQSLAVSKNRMFRCVHDDARNWEEIRAPGRDAASDQTGREGPQWTVGDDVTYSKKCDPYEQGGLPLSKEQVAVIRAQVPEWTVSEDAKSISKDWTFEDFPAAVSFLQKISVLCVNEGHPPASASIQAARGSRRVLRMVLHTSRLGGLSYADFMLALKLDFLR